MISSELRPLIKDSIKKVFDELLLVRDSKKLLEFPELKEIIINLFSINYEMFIDGIELISPNPICFRILLKNKQSFYLIKLTRYWRAQIEGKNYDLSSPPSYKYATKSLSRLLRYTTKIDDKKEENNIPEYR